MHPAKSVIFFTTTSGAGYGLMFLTILMSMTDTLPTAAGPAPAATVYAVAYLLITAGLLASTFHLGHPERAWRALSQWRSSWLSREGVAAVFTYLPTGIYAIASLVTPAPTHPAVLAIGALGLVGCAVTVWCTAMIYASLKPVHAWCNGFVPASYLWFGLMTGGLVLDLLLRVFAVPSTGLSFSLPAAIVVGLAIKWAYWRRIDGSAGASTPETATGLGRFGTVRSFEALHGQANYLMQEMVFEIARTHADALRRGVYVMLFAAPAILCLAAAVLSSTVAAVAAGTALASATVGIGIERWLFFAEARHTVGLYYGRTAA